MTDDADRGVAQGNQRELFSCVSECAETSEIAMPETEVPLSLG